MDYSVVHAPGPYTIWIQGQTHTHNWLAYTATRLSPRISPALYI